MKLAWLTGTDIGNIVQKNKLVFATNQTRFYGVFALDRLPRLLPDVPAVLIINNDPANLPGRHWKAIYISRDRIGEVFDSLATPMSIALERWMHTHCVQWTCSQHAIQHPLSPTCGAFVLHFVFNRPFHNSLQAYMDKYFTIGDARTNEVVVEMFMYTLSQ